MRLIVDPEKCTECGRCTLVCSFSKTGRIQPKEARITVERRWPDLPEIKVCRFEECMDHPCVASCPFKAIFFEDGKVLITNETCKGCGLCVTECPFQAISLGGTAHLAYKCDLCGGEPACVAECITGAIRIEE